MCNGTLAISLSSIGQWLIVSKRLGTQVIGGSAPKPHPSPQPAISIGLLTASKNPRNYE